MIRLIIRPEAEEDIAAAYKEHLDLGHGAQFMARVNDSIDKIVAGPLRYAILYEPVRRVLVRRYPYGLFYLVNATTIVVLALRHQRQDPVDHN